MEPGRKISFGEAFDSIFDVQRYGFYNISQDRTLHERFREICAKMSNSALFINFIMIVILVNTITMATEHYQQVSEVL